MMRNTMHSFENSSFVPAFLTKLWKLVEDPKCDELIAWSDSGFSFVIKDQARFAKELLPLYFKHLNMASFFRKMTLYGFKKVMYIEKPGLRNEIGYQNMFFIKENSELLKHIKREIREAEACPSVYGPAHLWLKPCSGEVDSFINSLDNWSNNVSDVVVTDYSRPSGRYSRNQNRRTRSRQRQHTAVVVKDDDEVTQTAHRLELSLKFN